MASKYLVKTRSWLMTKVNISKKKGILWEKISNLWSQEKEIHGNKREILK